MAGQNSTVVRPAHHDTGMSFADELAHRAASYVRRSAPKAPREAVSYTDLARAEHDRHCARCRTLTADTAGRADAYGESIRLRDRLTLGFRPTTAGSIR